MAYVRASTLNECADGCPIPSRFPRIEASISPCVFAVRPLRWSGHWRWNKIPHLRRHWAPLSVTGAHPRPIPRDSAPERRSPPPGRPETASRPPTFLLPSPRPKGQGQMGGTDGASRATEAASFRMYFSQGCVATVQPSDRTRDRAFLDGCDFPAPSPGTPPHAPKSLSLNL